MSWDWEKTLSDIGQDISDIAKSQYALSYAKDAQALTAKSMSSIIIPLGILGIVFLLVWKRKI